MIRDFNCDKLRVRVFETRQEMGSCAGAEAAEILKKLLGERESVNVMFAAAPSQNETLAALLEDPAIDWSRINAFHMDEYVGLDPEHPAGFRNYLHRAIFGRKPFKSIHFINGNAPDPVREAQRYDALLREHPLDLCILGVGENGHIAFNDPPVADFRDKSFVKLVELEQRCREQQVHDGCFEHLSQVPTHALTVTVPGLCQAGTMICSVPASTKADAVRQMLQGEITTECPASILRTHSDARLYVDKDAGRFILNQAGA